MKYDIVIIGNGPAGCSAALYSFRSGADVCVISLDDSSLLKTEKIENYYGIGTVSGESIYKKGISQCKELGVKMLEGQVTSISFGKDSCFEIDSTVGNITAKSVIIACGRHKNKVDIAGVEKFVGRGVSFCAVCDGFFFKNKTIGVIGSGDFAVNEAKYLKGISDRVTVFSNGEEIKADTSGLVVNGLKIKEICGEKSVEKILFDDGTYVPIDGVFIASGVASSDDFSRNLGLSSTNGKFNVDENMQTNIPGVFAAGDCKQGIDQIASAVYEGMTAGMAASKYVKKSGLN